MENLNKKERKIAFILIIILFLFSLFFTGFSVYFKILGKDIPPEPINTLKELYFDGKIWFYDASGSLLGKYVCNNPDGICELAKNANYDDNYKINNYSKGNDAQIDIVNNKYAFIRDVENESDLTITLYDILNDYVYPTADKSLSMSYIKNYGIGIDDDYFVVQRRNNEYGLLQLKKDAAPFYKVNFGYDYLAFKNNVTDKNKIDSNVVVANKAGQWFLMNLDEEHLSVNTSDSIVDFKEDSIITVDGLDQYHYINYEGEKIIPDNGYINIYYVGKCLALINKEELVIMDINTLEKMGNPIMIDSEKKYLVEENDAGQIIVLVDGTITETLDFG